MIIPFDALGRSVNQVPVINGVGNANLPTVT